MEKSTYSIRELEELSGIPAHTIRTWERRYQLLSPARDQSNVRCYGREVVAYLRHLAILIRHGHRISALACKSRGEIQALALELIPPMPDEFTSALCHAMEEYNISRLESLISSHIRREGFDQALLLRFIPFLEKIGFLIVSGTLKLVHAQMFNDILRQKLFSTLEQASLPGPEKRWVILHGKPEADGIHRDILLYLLRKSGRQVISVEVSGQYDLASMHTQAAIDGVMIVVDSAVMGDRLASLLEDAATVQGETLVFTPGKTLDFANNGQIPDIHILYGLRNAFQHLMIER